MLSVCHLYPDLLNLYGDRGNIIAFVKRCRWRGIAVSVEEVGLGDPVDFKKFDFVFLGGGSDREQGLIAGDLMKRRENFWRAIEQGLVVLAICGGYQLLGKCYLTASGDSIPGLGVMDFFTAAGERRLLGNVAVETVLDGNRIKVCGFENHSGQTFLGDVEPFGRVLTGGGNNGRDGWEGARYRNVFCSYMHGPLLPKNARLTDHLISLALRRRGAGIRLNPLESVMEDHALKKILKRLKIRDDFFNKGEKGPCFS